MKHSDYLEAKKTNCMENDKKEDVVNHPKHYESGNYECIDEMLKDLGKENVLWFCIGNTYKYLWRSTHKNGWEDLKKAKWYLNKFFELADIPEIENKTVCNIHDSVPLDLLIETQGLKSVIDYLRIEAFIYMKKKIYDEANELINTAVKLMDREEF